MKFKFAVIAAVSILVLFSGCKHDDDLDAYDKVKLPNGYEYMIYDSPYSQGDSIPLYVVIGGYPGGYEKHIANAVVKYLERNKLPGISLLPYIKYNSDKVDIESFLEMIEFVISETRHDENRTNLIGFSAGACTVLSMSNRMCVSGIVSLSPGAYKDGGGTPEDEMGLPDTDVDTWILNGYSTKTLSKEGVYWDGTVYVDPVIRMVTRCESEKIKHTLIPDIGHSGTRKLIENSDEILNWLTDIGSPE